MSRAAAAGTRCCWRARASTCAPSIAIRRRSRSCAIPRRSSGWPINAEVVDLETDPPPAIATEFDAVLVFNYLHRPLMPALRDALKPGGRIFYETFTTRQAERGHPTQSGVPAEGRRAGRADGAARDPAIAGRRVRQALHRVGRRGAPVDEKSPAASRAPRCVYTTCLARAPRGETYLPLTPVKPASRRTARLDRVAMQDNRRSGGRDANCRRSVDARSVPARVTYLALLAECARCRCRTRPLQHQPN